MCHVRDLCTVVAPCGVPARAMGPASTQTPSRPPVPIPTTPSILSPGCRAVEAVEAPSRPLSSSRPCLSSSCRACQGLSRLTPCGCASSCCRGLSRAVEFLCRGCRVMSSVLLSSRMACSFAILHEAHLCSLTLTAVGLEDPHINHQPNYKVKRIKNSESDPGARHNLSTQPNP